MHDVASSGFDKEAAAYARSRPSYPHDCVAWLAATLDIAPRRRVCDLAAGTGILTRLLEPFGSELIAAEPVPAMRGQLLAGSPGLPTLAAIAESLPFAADSLDALTVAQAFHWFDAERALAEFRRVLRVGRRFALIWNARDRSRAWVNEVWSVMDRVEKRAPWRNHDHVATSDGQARREESLRGAPGFGEPHTATFQHEQALTPEGVVDRVRGVSHVAVLPNREREHVLDEVRTIVREHPDARDRELLAIPYRVDCYWLERVD